MTMYAKDPAVNELLAAADGGCLARVVELLDGGLPVDSRQHEGMTALLFATRSGQIPVMHALLARGASLDPDPPGECTALTRAIYRAGAHHYYHVGLPDPEPLKILLAAGARYSLLDAVLLADVALVEARLEDGGDPNKGEDSYNGPLLMEAARLGHARVVELLLDRGARIEATDDLGQTSLGEAAEYGHVDVVRLLLDRGADISSGSTHESPLGEAALNGHGAVVELLIARGAERGLLDALALGDRPLFETILDQRLVDVGEAEPVADPDESDLFNEDRRRAKVDRVSCYPDRPAMLAARTNQVEILALLLDRGASNCLGRWPDHHSLLGEAARHGHVAAVRLLLERGADVHAVGSDETTPLALALAAGRAEVVALLRAAGAER